MPRTLGENVLRKHLLGRLNGLKRMGASSRKLAFVRKLAPGPAPMLNQVGTIIKRIRTTAKSLGPEGAPGAVPGVKLPGLTKGAVSPALVAPRVLSRIGKVVPKATPARRMEIAQAHRPEGGTRRSLLGWVKNIQSISRPKLSADDAREMLKEALQRRKKRPLGERVRDVAAKVYTSPLTWTVIGAGTGAGAALLGTRKAGKNVVLRIPSRKALVAAMATWAAASNALETAIDRVAFGKAYKARKREGKLWRAER